MRKKYLRIYPHNDGRSMEFSVPNWVYYSLKYAVVLILVFLGYFNALQIYYNYSLNKAEKMAEFQEQRWVVASDLLKSYSIAYTKKQNYLVKDLDKLSIETMPRRFVRRRNIETSLFDQGLGGSGQKVRNNKLVDKYGDKLVDQKLLAFEKKIDYSQIIDKDILSMAESLDSIRNFNIEISERKNLINSLPILWPVRKNNGTYISQKDKKSSQFYLYFKKPTEIIATARGKVIGFSHSPFSKDGQVVTIQHDYGVQTHYHNMGNLKVEKGALVEKGQVIGTSQGMFNYQVKLGTKFIDPHYFTLIRY